MGSFLWLGCLLGFISALPIDPVPGKPDRGRVPIHVPDYAVLDTANQRRQENSGNKG